MLPSSQKPLVSVICLCYNHEEYVVEALHSVLNQTYNDIEIIVVDDASTDESQKVIQQHISIHPHIKFIPFAKNVGNCAAFNKGFRLSKGKYVIDFATDDVMSPERIEKQVALLEQKGEEYGVAFSDAYLIDEEGKKLKTYYPRDNAGKLTQKVPEDEVYMQLIKQQFVCTPTMMIRRKVLEQLGGYDEELVYEDYDFWVRSGKLCQYAFSEELLTAKRMLPASHGKNFYNEKAEPYLVSTLKVCYKAYQLNETRKEHKALAHSVRYHMRLSLFTEHFKVAEGFWRLLWEMKKISLVDMVFIFFIKIKIPLLPFYRVVRRWKSGYISNSLKSRK